MGLPSYKTAAVISSIVGTWVVAAPFALPIHKQLNPKLLNIDPPAPVHSIPRIITVDDAPLPQINRKVIPQSSPPDNPPPGRRASIPASIGTADASYYAQPRDKFPFPDAVTSQPTPNRAWLTAIDAWRVTPDQTPQRRESIPGNLLDNTPIDPPPGSARSRIVSLEDAPLPPTNRKLAQGIVPDSPPFGQKKFGGWGEGDPVVTAIDGGQFTQGIDSAPGGIIRWYSLVLGTWIVADPPLQARRFLAVDGVPATPPVIDQPPVPARSRIVSVDDAPLPPTNRKLTGDQLNVTLQIDNPPFGQVRSKDPWRSWTNDPLPTLRGKLPAGLLDNPPQIDPPPGSARSRIIVVDDGPLPQLNHKLSGDLYGPPAEVEPPEPPHGGGGGVGRHHGHGQAIGRFKRKKYLEELRELRAARVEALERAEELKRKPQAALVKAAAAVESLIKEVPPEQPEDESGLHEVRMLLEAATRARNAAEIIERSREAMHAAQAMLRALEEEDEVIALLLLS